EVRPGVNEDFHCRSAVVKDAIHCVKNGRVPPNAFPIVIDAGVYVSAVIEQDAGTTQGIKLGADVQWRNAPAGSESAQQAQFLLQAVSGFGQKSAESSIVIKQNRFEQRIADRCARIKHYL